MDKYHGTSVAEKKGTCVKWMATGVRRVFETNMASKKALRDRELGEMGS